MINRPGKTGVTVGIVLAAGGSSRLGQPKQLIEVDGQPMLVRAVDALMAVKEIDLVFVVLGASADAMRAVLQNRPVTIVPNPRWAEGQASSLHAAMTALAEIDQPVDRILITLCDQPKINPAAFQALFDALGDNSGHSVAAARYDGHPGAPCIFAARHFDALRKIEGDRGARHLLRSLPSAEVAGVELPELAFDLDTPEDLARWVKSPRSCG